MCGLALTISAMSKTLKPVVVGNSTGFGLDDDTGRKFKQPGLGKLGDYVDVHRFESGFFDTETCSKLVLGGSDVAHITVLPNPELSVLCHDAVLML